MEASALSFCFGTTTKCPGVLHRASGKERQIWSPILPSFGQKMGANRTKYQRLGHFQPGWLGVLPASLWAVCCARILECENFKWGRFNRLNGNQRSMFFAICYLLLSPWFLGPRWLLSLLSKGKTPAQNLALPEWLQFEPSLKIFAQRETTQFWPGNSHTHFVAPWTKDCFVCTPFWLIAA